MTEKFKVVEGQTKRAFVETDQDEVWKKLKNKGFTKEEAYNKPKLKTAPQILKIAEKKKLAPRSMKHLEGMIAKPPGKRTVVPVTDKRPAINQSAAEMFAD